MCVGALAAQPAAEAAGNVAPNSIAVQRLFQQVRLEVATTVDGKLKTVEGMGDHPYSEGTLCGRGHGTAQWAYSDGRLTQPMKRTADGGFEPISWDAAFEEIGQTAEGHTGRERPRGPGHHPGPAAFWQEITASGSSMPSDHANIYTHAAACNLSKESGIQQATGAQNFSVDFGNTKMVVFIGRSYGDGIRPSSVKSLAQAADNGARIVLVDPRLNNTNVMATDWVPIKPGFDVALLPGHCQRAGRPKYFYHHDFVEESCVGFPEFAQQVAQYTPEWAEKLCDVPAH